MFESRIGATSGEEGKVYLRPETAQGIFVNFKNVVDTMAPKMHWPAQEWQLKVKEDA